MNANTLEGVETFVLVVENKGFSAASRVSGHSISFLIKSVNKLEERLKTLLLNRTTRNISLTPEGKIFYLHCLEILTISNKAIETLEGVSQDPQGKLKISCSELFGIQLLQPLITKFLSKHPKIDIELILENQCVDIVGGRYDLAFRAGSSINDSNFIIKKIYETKLCLVASQDYIKSNGSIESPSDILQHRMLLIEQVDDPNIWNFLDLENKEKIKSKIGQKFISNSDIATYDACKSGLGVARLPIFNFDENYKKQNMRVLMKNKFTPIDDEFSVYLIYPTKKFMSLKLRSFIDFASKYFEEHKGDFVY